MNSNTILTSDVLDILFENRNKQYGAYMLRKFYPNRVKTALCIMLSMAALFSAFSFLPEKKNVPGYAVFYKDSIMVREIKNDDKPLDKPKTKSQTAVASSQKKYVSSFVIVDSTKRTDTLDDISHSLAGSINVMTGIEGPGDIDPAPMVAGNGDAPPTPEPPIDNSTPVDNPDIQASFPGGAKALVSFLQRNLHAPGEMGEGSTVQVKVKFVVGFDGNLQSFDVLKDGGIAFNEEVIRVLKKMPRWNPGKKGGRDVPVYYYLPVTFAANE